MDFIHLEEALEQIQHPQQGDTRTNSTDLHNRRHTKVSVLTGLLEDKDEPEEVVGPPGQLRSITPGH